MSHKKLLGRMSKVLEDKYVLYKQLGGTKQLDDWGFLKDTVGDSALWSSLYNIGYGNWYNLINIGNAEELPGKWIRHPSLMHGKWKEVSKSSISRDMFIGIFWYLYLTNNLTSVNSLIRYAWRHCWIMGEYKKEFKKELYDDIVAKIPSWIWTIFSWLLKPIITFIATHEAFSRVIMTPTLMTLLYEMRYWMGGGNSILRYILMPEFPNLKNYQAHIQALYIALQGELRGEIPDQYYTIVKKLVGNNPHNALFQALYHKYTDGDFIPVAQLLINTPYFPEGGLPTSRNRRAFWLWQYDEGWMWAPAPPNIPQDNFSGGDLLFICKYIEL